MERSGSSPGLNLQNRVCQANSDCSSACLCKSPNLFRARPFWQRCLMDVASIMYFSITRAIFSFLAHWHLICAMSSLYYCQIPLTPFHLVSYIELVDLSAPPSHSRMQSSPLMTFILLLLVFDFVWCHRGLSGSTCFGASQRRWFWGLGEGVVGGEREREDEREQLQIQINMKSEGTEIRGTEDP